jgi:hypothetical protein
VLLHLALSDKTVQSVVAHDHVRAGLLHAEADTANLTSKASALVGKVKVRLNMVDGKGQQEQIERVQAYGASQRHVMISYCWAQQDTVMRIKSSLTDRGYNCWLDVEQMSGSTVDAMADAIDHSYAVVYGISLAYKESANCRLEAMYAHQAKVQMIPMLLQDGYVAKGWLGMLLGTQLWYGFFGSTLATESAFAKQIDQLCRPLGNPNRAHRGLWGVAKDKLMVATPSAPAPAPTPVPALTLAPAPAPPPPPPPETLTPTPEPGLTSAPTPPPPPAPVAAISSLAPGRAYQSPSSTPHLALPTQMSSSTDWGESQQHRSLPIFQSPSPTQIAFESSSPLLSHSYMHDSPHAHPGQQELVRARETIVKLEEKHERSLLKLEERKKRSFVVEELATVRVMVARLEAELKASEQARLVEQGVATRELKASEHARLTEQMVAAAQIRQVVYTSVAAVALAAIAVWRR